MWGRKNKEAATAPAGASPLKEAMHQARVEAAERTSVVVDLRDAEVARLELLNEALDPLFADIPARGRSVRPRRQPRRDAAAVDRCRRACRHGARQAQLSFLHDSRIGRHVLAESHEIADIVQAVTAYVARRLIERQRALDEDPGFIARVPAEAAARYRRRRRWRALGALLLGFVIGDI